jgi:hypothetical protein
MGSIKQIFEAKSVIRKLGVRNRNIGNELMAVI